MFNDESVVDYRAHIAWARVARRRRMPGKIFGSHADEVEPRAPSRA